MKNWLSSIRTILFLNLIMAACAPAVPTATPVSTQEPSPTNEPLLITPVESAFAPENATAAPLDDIIRTHSVTFNTTDGATVNGELYGSGKTAVVFSVMGNCKPGWREFAQLTAAQGFMALAYQWHACRESGSTDENELQKFVEDARAAVNFVRERGAEKIILVGASLGGVASAKLAIESQASGLVILASPPSIPQWGFEIEPDDLNTDIPKLFITAENDDTVPADSMRALYDLAAEPKEWQTYPGTAHGTDLLKGVNGPELGQRILAFILMVAEEK
ncbi:MAG TPA: dienelactone hydrolase family protein [Anaerolineales bacterium]|nr:dienelactone hydrolase family protein [Anaerolineales bacterium]